MYNLHLKLVNTNCCLPPKLLLAGIMSEALNIRLNHNKADEFRNDPHTHPQKWSLLIYFFYSLLVKWRKKVCGRGVMLIPHPLLVPRSEIE